MKIKHLYVTNIITGILVAYGANTVRNIYTENPCQYYNPEPLGGLCPYEVNYFLVYGISILIGVIIGIIISAVLHFFIGKKK